MKRKWKACLCIAAFLLAVLPVSASADIEPKTADHHSGAECAGRRLLR